MHKAINFDSLVFIFDTAEKVKICVSVSIYMLYSTIYRLLKFIGHRSRIFQHD